MRIFCEKDYVSLSRRAADIIIGAVNKKPDCVLGLATGSTPIGVYDMLSSACAAGKVSFARVRTVNLDEYMGLAAGDPASYRAFMNEHLFRRIDIDIANTHIPDASAGDENIRCARYDALIESLGGVDLQLLGIGRNGHIGFNEPSPYFSVGTHEAELSQSTRRANAAFFGNDENAVPKSAITMGIGSIMKARSILLLASGEAKREALTRAVRGNVDPMVPASVLQLHGDVSVICDFQID